MFKITYTYPNHTRAFAPVKVDGETAMVIAVQDLEEHGAIDIVVTKL
jgi:hypothetical protein